jgi:hypothetical protein
MRSPLRTKVCQGRTRNQTLLPVRAGAMLVYEIQTDDVRSFALAHIAADCDGGSRPPPIATHRSSNMHTIAHSNEPLNLARQETAHELERLRAKRRRKRPLSA